MLRNYLNKVEHYVHTVFELNSVLKILVDFMNELDIHFLAMLNHQHSYMHLMTRKAVLKRVAFHTQRPLLVIIELGLWLAAGKKSEVKNSLSL